MRTVKHLLIALTIAVMTVPLPQHAQNGSPALDPARLAAANINPKTGLASDYLNHFSEAIMIHLSGWGYA